MIPSPHQSFISKLPWRKCVLSSSFQRLFSWKVNFQKKRWYNKRVPVNIRFFSRPTSQKVLLVSVKSIKKLLKNAKHFPERIVSYITHIKKFCLKPDLGQFSFLPCYNLAITFLCLIQWRKQNLDCYLRPWYKLSWSEIKNMNMKDKTIIKVSGYFFVTLKTGRLFK